MNAKAQGLGMADTVFKNPNGMPADGQLTTARDMLRLSASYLRRFPQALTFHSMTTYVHNNRNTTTPTACSPPTRAWTASRPAMCRPRANNVVTAKRGDAGGGRGAAPTARPAPHRQLLDITFRS
jgi:hypothetical protein